jgi:hypothetical protein
MSEERRSTLPPDATDEEKSSSAKRLVERLLKKGIESGIGAISKSEDTVRGVIEGMKIPKEMIALALDQMDETKNGLYRAVAKEIRDFLQSTNFASEMKKILTGLAFEVKMEVRFKSTDEEGGTGTGSIRPDVSADVSLKESEHRKRRRSASSE